MPALRYSGSQLVSVENVSNTVPTIVDNAVRQINENKTITVKQLELTPGANGGVSVSISATITGTYGELSTLESTLADEIAALGFESDAEAAKKALTLE